MTNKDNVTKNTLLRSMSDYSLMKSGSLPFDLSIKANDLGWRSLAVTDFNTMAGVDDFVGYKAAKGVKNPICGVDLFVALSHQPDLPSEDKVKSRLPDDAPLSDFQKQYLPVENLAGGRVCFLAKSKAGYRSISKLLERAWGRQKVSDKKKGQKTDTYIWALDDQYLLPSDILELSHDVIMLTGKEEEGLLSFIFKHSPSDSSPEGHPALDIWDDEVISLFEGFHQKEGCEAYLEFCRYFDRNQHVKFNPSFDDWLEQSIPVYRLPPVATWDIRYATKEDRTTFLLQEAQAIGEIVQVDERGHALPEEGGECEYHIPSPAQFIEAFSDRPSLVQAANDLGEKCNFQPQSSSPIMPLANDEDLDPEFLNYHPDDTDAVRQEKHDEAAKKTLERRSWEGLKSRLEIKKNNGQFLSPEEVKIYEDRLIMELDVISSRGYADYFIIVSEFISWSLENGIPVGPGRGSGAGSLVAWCLRITQPDPIEFGLLFERFLNPERKSMPDFDIDFGEGRDRTLLHMSEKYGADRVCGISTVTKLMPKGAIADALRSASYYNSPCLNDKDVAGFSNSFRDAKQAALSLTEVIELSHKAAISGEEPDFSSKNRSLEETLKTFYPSWLESSYGHPVVEKDGEKYFDSPSHSILRAAGRLWGHIRSSGQHAAGLILTPKAVTDYIPVIRLDSSKRECMRLSALGMKGAERFGGVKFDFLGLNNLNVIDETLRVLEKSDPSSKPDFDSLIDFDVRPDGGSYDEIYDAIAKFKTQGVFQLDSGGMGEALRDVRPHRFSDIVAVISLYRPGPMENIPLYAKRNRQRQAYNAKLKEAEAKGLELPEKPTYNLSQDPVIQEILSRILDETLGIFVYQEQIMLVAMEMADYSLGEADLLRRAMGKKDKEEMARQGKRFIEGASKKGMAPFAIELVFEQMEKFADYGFNKSHAVAYAFVSWRTTYLKVYHPEAFTAAAINCVRPTSLPPIIAEMQEAGVKILPPDINKSELHAVVEKNPETGEVGVRPGLSTLGGAKKGAAILINERNLNGPYKSLRDYALRTRDYQFDGSKVGIKSSEAFVRSGALDRLPLSDVDEEANETIGNGQTRHYWDGKELTNRRLREFLLRILLKKKPIPKPKKNQPELTENDYRAYWAWPEDLRDFSIPTTGNLHKEVSRNCKLSEIPDYPLGLRKRLAFKHLHYYEERSEEEEISYLAERYGLPLRIPGVYLEFLKSIQIGQETHLPDKRDYLDMLSGVTIAGRVNFVGFFGRNLRVEISNDRDRSHNLIILNVQNQAELKKNLEGAKKNEVMLVFPDCDISETGDAQRRWVRIKCFSPKNIIPLDQYVEGYVATLEKDRDGISPKVLSRGDRYMNCNIYEAGNENDFDNGVNVLNETGYRITEDPFKQPFEKNYEIVILRFFGRMEEVRKVPLSCLQSEEWNARLDGCYIIAEGDAEEVQRAKDNRLDEEGVSFLYRSSVKKRLELEERFLTLNE